MKIINQCQHTENGQCERCKNFRSRPAIKKHMQYNPFNILEFLLLREGQLAWPAGRLVVHGQR